MNNSKLIGQAIFLRFLEPEDAPAVLALYKLNRDFLAPWEPQRHAEFFTLSAQRDSLQNMVIARQADQAYGFGIFLKETGQLIGRINLSNIVRGVFLNATLGYMLAQEHNGHGYTTEAVRMTLRFAFNELGLHRIQAGTMLQNFGSQRVLEKAGFRREGISLRYLHINGKWEDHYMFAITSEEFKS